MSLISVITVGFLCFMVIYSIIKRPKKQSASDFQTMNSSANWFVIAGTYTSTLLSAVGMVGLPAISYGQGYLLGILNWGVPFAFLLTALYIGPRLRLFGVVTLSEFFEKRFCSKSLKLISAVVTILGTGAYFISQTIGSAVILAQLTAIPYDYTVLLSLFVVLVFCFVGGTRSVSLVNTFMALIIVLGLGLIFAPTIIGMVGLDKIREYAVLRPDFFGWNGPDHTPVGTIAGFLAVWALGIAANPVNVTRAFIAKDNREWIKGLMVGLVATILLIWMMHTSSMAIRVFNPDNPEIKVASASLTWAAINIVPLGIGVIATLGLVAACLSTANSQILVVAQSVINDIYTEFNKKLTPERGVTLIKITLIVLSVISLYFTLGRPGFIVIFGNFGASVFAAAFFPVIVISLGTAKISRAAAVWSMSLGIIVDFSLHLYPAVFLGKAFGYAGYLPFSIHPVLWGAAAAFLAIPVVTAISKPSEAEIGSFNTALGDGALLEESESSDESMIRWSYGLIVAGLVLFAGIVWFSTIV